MRNRLCLKNDGEQRGSTRTSELFQETVFIFYFLFFILIIFFVSPNQWKTTCMINRNQANEGLFEDHIPVVRIVLVGGGPFAQDTERSLQLGSVTFQDVQ